MKRPTIETRNSFLFRKRIQSKDSLIFEMTDDATSPSRANSPRLLRKNSAVRTIDSFFRSKRSSHESAVSIAPDLSCGESSRSEESLPSTPRTSISIAYSPTTDFAIDDIEQIEQDKHESLERESILRDRAQFQYRNNIIPHHLYRSVPYMQSYSHISLLNDHCTYELLHHLTPDGSLTFHDFGSKPPRDVLDLGCGEGYWAVDAALTWRKSYITAFDLVDLGRPLRKVLDSDTSKRLEWIQGDFLKGRLPFQSHTFDFVRMAGLSLAVPVAQWSSLLLEVRRILKHDGKLEIIDDELSFPDIQIPSAVALRRATIINEPNDTMFDLDAGPPAPPDSSSSRLADFKMKVSGARSMETTFRNMLSQTYGISPTPHEFLESLLSDIYEPDRTVNCEEKTIVLPSENFIQNRGRHALRANQEHDGEDGLDALPQFPMSVSPKAKRLLQMTMGPRRPYQPPGFIVLPSTFVPCEPETLEMHACKNIHVLLSCKVALAEYVGHRLGPDGERLVSASEFEELFWEYEQFRRRRLNWPSDHPGVRMADDDEVTSPVMSKSQFNLSELGRRKVWSTGNRMNTVVTRGDDDVLPIRTIRVYTISVPPPDKDKQKEKECKRQARKSNSSSYSI